MAKDQKTTEDLLTDYYLNKCKRHSKKKQISKQQWENEELASQAVLKFLEKSQDEKIEQPEHFLNATYKGYRRHKDRDAIVHDQYVIFEAEPGSKIDAETGSVTETVSGKIDGIRNHKEIIEHVFSKLIKTQQRQLFTLYFIKNLSQVRISEILSISEATVSRKVAQLTVRLEKIAPDLMCDADIVLSSIDIGNSRQGDVPQEYDSETLEAGEIVQIKKASYRPQTTTPRYPAVWNTLKSVGTMPLVTSWFTLQGSKETVSTLALLSGKKDLMKKHELYRSLRFSDLSPSHPANLLFKRAINWADQTMLFDMKPKKSVEVVEDTKSLQNVILIKTGTNGTQIPMF